MHIEFRCYLTRLFEAWGVNVSSAAIQVEDCPNYLEYQVCSPCLFELRSELVQQKNFKSGVNASPVEIAEELVRFSQGSTEREFDISVGGRGYLNASLNKKCVENILCGIEEQGISFFFNVPVDIGGRNENGLSAETPTSEWFDALTVDLLRRGRESSDDAIVAFTAGLPSELSREKHRNDLLMLTAVLAKEETDIRVYQKGISGKQNLPWYLDRFSQDWRFLVASASISEAFECSDSRKDVRLSSIHFLESLDRIGPSVRLSESSVGMGATVPELSIYSWRVFSHILRFRFFYQMFLRNRRPEILLAAVIDAIDEFYRFYNHPTFRQQVVVDPSNKDLVVISLFTSILAQWAEEVLREQMFGSNNT